MPLLETIGSGGARGYGMFGKTEFAVNSLYSTATVYAPLIDDRIYTSGSRNLSYAVSIEAQGEFATDSVNGKKVLASIGDAGHKFKIPQVSNPSSSHTLSVWVRNRQTSGSGCMLFSKFAASNDSQSNPSGNPYNYALNTYDNGTNISLNIGDGDQNKFNSSGTYGFVKMDTNWNHWALTFNGSQAKLYRNGVNIGSPPTYRSFVNHFGSWVLSGWASDQYGGYSMPYSNFAHFAYWNGVEKTQSNINDMIAVGPY
jgi:hypothetical protein